MPSARCACFCWTHVPRFEPTWLMFAEADSGRVRGRCGAACGVAVRLPWQLSCMEFQHGDAWTCASAKEVASRPATLCGHVQSTMELPMKLSCNHIFCDGCISHWFDFNHSTCPMCRAVVRPSSVQSYGDGWTSMLPQLF